MVFVDFVSIVSYFFLVWNAEGQMLVLAICRLVIPKVIS